MAEEDLSHYTDQPDRLIDEFKKMKATKKRAEQFAIDAKQSAQKVYELMAMCMTCTISSESDH